MVHPVIDDNRKNNQKRTRIAILDTGVDITHPHIQAAKEAKQIVAFFPESANWTADSDSDAFRDSNGHGTHGTSVLLRTAPNSAIYIAKVADEDGKLIYDDIVKVLLLNFGSLKTDMGLGNRVGDSKAGPYHFDFLGNKRRHPFHFNGSESSTQGRHPCFCLCLKHRRKLSNYLSSTPARNLLHWLGRRIGRPIHI